MSNAVPIKGETDKELGAQFAPLSVSAQLIPNLTVSIRAGSFWNADNEVVEFPGGNSPAIAAPGSLNRWTLVSLNAAGSVVLTHGTSSAAPAIPAPPTGNLPLAAVYMTSATTQITSVVIMDVRPQNRVVADPTAALVDYPTFTDMNNALALKADVDGTPNSQFYMNKGAAGPANALFSIDRGASVDVSIRWNEATDKWQFTNDGTTFVDMASVSGSFMPIQGAAVSGNVGTFNGVGEIIDSGTALTALATDVEIATKLDDFVGVNGNVVVVAGLGTALADGGIALSALATDAEVAALDALVVHLAGTETITGTKTFSAAPTFANAGNSFINFTKGAASDAGIHVDRGVDPFALLEWDETTDQWIAGVNGSAFPILTAENLALDDLTDVVLTAPATNNVLQYNGTDWVNTAKITLAAGTAALPAYTFASDATKGTYDSGAGRVSIAIAGAEKVRFDAGGVTTFSGYAQGGVGGMALWHTATPAVGVTLAAGNVAMTNGANSITVSPVGVAFTGTVTLPGGGSPVATTRAINTTVGDLTGGGDLSADRTLSLATTAVIPGAFGSATAVGTFTVDTKGRLTAAGATPIAILGGQLTIAGTSGNVVSLNGSNNPVDSGIEAVDVFLRDGSVLAVDPFDMNGNGFYNVVFVDGKNDSTMAITAGTNGGGTTSGNNVFVRGGPAVNGMGGGVLLFGRDGAGVDQDGGSVLVFTGAKTGLGSPGYFEVGTPAGQSLKVTGVGNVVLGLTTDPIAATDGFPYIPFTTTAGTPSGTPTAVAGFAPMIAQDDGGVFTLWIYMSGAWRAATLV